MNDSISSAPKRPQKLGSVQTIVRNEDMFKTSKTVQFEEITLSDDDDETNISLKKVKCPTCPRDMTLWTVSRREIHTSVCKKHDEDKKEKPKRKLTETIEKDDKVKFVEPKLPKEPLKSWEVSKNNVKFARIASDDEENRRRKRPRSFAVVELAPKKCQCEVVTTLHSRFMDEFHWKSLQNKAKQEEGLSEHAFQMSRMIERLSRYEQLSSDMQKVFDDPWDPSPSQIIIKCSDGEVKIQKLILKHRTTLLKIHPSGDVQWEKPRETVRSWLTYVYTANMEWSEDQVEDVLELAMKYGPVGLENVMKASRRRESPVLNDPQAPTASEVNEVAETTETPAEAQEVAPEPEIDIYTSDDPFIGFGNAVEEPENNEEDDEILMMEDIAVPSSTMSTPQKSGKNATMDSFDEWSNQDLHNRSQSSPIISINSVVTPIRNTQKPMFGSHVKILKTNDVTPMPEFDKMDEAELKERMKEIGMRPKGKKAMIQLLKKAYTTLHPEICAGTPTIRPLVRPEIEEAPEKSKKLKKTLSERLASPKKVVKVRETEEKKEEEEEEEVSEADKTLNLSNDEREIGRICGDDVVGEEEEEEEAGCSTGKKDLDELRKSFLTWLRSPQNIVLYEHILSLNPVSLEEMLIRLEKAEGPLGRIGKGKLVKLLEMLKITYQLPQKGGARKMGGGFKRRR